jgi:FKBP-type peptidyl-prolyl cis-trans isomerase
MMRPMLRPALAFLCLALAVPAAAAERYGLSQNENIRFLADMEKRPGMQKLDNGVLYRVQASGSGEAVAGRDDKVTVSYTGYLINGTRFDQTPPGKPRSFIVSRVIPGWTGALLKMREGDRWEVIVPAELAYGGGSAGLVPPDQSLLFIIQLEHVEHPS